MSRSFGERFAPLLQVSPEDIISWREPCGKSKHTAQDQRSLPVQMLIAIFAVPTRVQYVGMERWAMEKRQERLNLFEIEIDPSIN